MTPEARALAQALINHQREVRQPVLAKDLNIQSILTTYGDLCERAGLPHVRPDVGKFLREIAQWCHDNRWPPLNSLAVNRETRRPGRGYGNAPGCSLERWRDDVLRCVQFSGYPEVVA
jgi:hypothetical protein